MIRRAVVAVAVALVAVTGAHSAPITPQRDDEVVETLPDAAGRRAEDRLLRRQLAQRPDDAALAVGVAQRHLERARSQGDPRHAGLALAALAPWKDPQSAPADVVLMQATLSQHLHEFDAAASMLEALLRREPGRRQGWLTLATVRRVQGRLDASDAACRSLAAAGGGLHAAACQAENDGLRGRTDTARSTLRMLHAAPRLDSGTRGWLLASLAELEERAGRPAEAESGWRAAMQADPGAYPRIAYADFLIGSGRHAEVPAALQGLPRSDVVVLRLAIAAARAGAAANDDAREMRERIALANLRPGTTAVHGREQAMFALWVDGQPGRALALAQANVQRQREGVDLLLLAQAARAAGDEAALRAADALRRQVGLHDRRIDALL